MVYMIQDVFNNLPRPVIGSQQKWSWGDYSWPTWPAQELGHDRNNSADTPLATVRKGQTESSVRQAAERAT